MIFGSPGEKIFYHKDYTEAEKKRANKYWMRAKSKGDVISKKVIVWDGEGMKLSGENMPQHYVLFGCSARPDSPLIIDNSRGNLLFEEIAEYCISVAEEYPNAIHLGYYFGYDQNMIIRSLPWPAKEAIYYKNACVVRRGRLKYYVRMISGKYIRITRIDEQENRVSILIEDFAPFFGKSFVAAYEQLFKPHERSEDWEVVKQGKADRAVTQYKDLGKVRRYWKAEIRALKDLAEAFRSIMFDAGFYLRQWHGPGALANYIRKTEDLIRHEWGGKEENLLPAVHEAIKGGFYGGRIEQFRVGYIEGPIHHFDINSAYPYAFCQVPTLEEGGEWRNVGAIDSERWFGDEELRTSFAIFKLEWRGHCSLGIRAANHMIQPLPHRDSKKSISYPSLTIGWYWAPEVIEAMNTTVQHIKQQTRTPGYDPPSCKILDGWVWIPNRDDVWPWEQLFGRYYKRRRVLKNNKNPTEMALKLGMNSMYGKMAQRAGGKESAPKSHTLCIAGFVTSTCRAAVARLMRSCIPETVISVETDGVFTTSSPEELTRKFTFGEGLGEWSHAVYDAMIIMQNGVYMIKQNGEWLPPKARGIQVRSLQDENGVTNPTPLLEHLSQCGPDHRWAPLKFEGGESFVRLGTAIARATRTNKRGIKSTNPFKASKLHCTWYADGKEIDLEGRNSKRSHHPEHCEACKRGETPDQTWHQLVIHSLADKKEEEINSTAHVLPWETIDEVDQWHQELKESEGIPETQV